MTIQARLHRPVEQERLEALAALGIDSPLKLDLISRLMAEPGESLRVSDLAARCGKSVGTLRHALQELAASGVVRCERFYNRETCRLSAGPAVLLHLSRLLGRTPSERRRLRFALLSNRH